MAVSALRPCIRVCALSQDQLRRRAGLKGPASRRPLAGHRGTGDQPPPLPPAQGPLPASRGLTQETTRPLKQGSLALSSEISSFTTLQADAAVRPLQWGLLPALGSGRGAPAHLGCRPHGASSHTPRCQPVQMPPPGISLPRNLYHPSKGPFQGPGPRGPRHSQHQESLPGRP